MHGTVAAARSERAEKPSKNLERPSEISEAKRLVQIAAEPRPPGDTVKRAVGRAALALGWRFGRTEDIWYGASRRIDSDEMDALRRIERRHKLRQLDNDFSRHVGQLAALRARLQTRDAEFHRADIDAITFLLDELQQALQR